VIQCYITDRGALNAGESLVGAISRNLARGPNWIQIRDKERRAFRKLVKAHRAYEDAGQDVENGSPLSRLTDAR